MNDYKCDEDIHQLSQNSAASQDAMAGEAGSSAVQPWQQRLQYPVLSQQHYNHKKGIRELHRPRKGCRAEFEVNAEE